MRAFRFLNAVILSVLVGSAAMVYAQEEKPEERPARQEEAKPQPKQEEARPSRQEEAKPPKQDRQMEKQDERRGQEQGHQQAAPERQERPEMQNDRNRQGQEHPEVQNGGARQEHSEHAGRARPEGRGGHIPDERFRAQFGREHHFNARTIIVSGQPRFQYGGYSFELVDDWPADWAYSDDCYIDYIDGQYYLIDLLHPGVRLAVFVVM